MSRNGNLVQSDTPGGGAAAMIDAPVPGASTLARILQLEAARASKSAGNAVDTSINQAPEGNSVPSPSADQPAEIISAASLEALEEVRQLPPLQTDTKCTS
jgi:hypothetical protein